MVATTGAHISFSNWAVGPKRGWSAPLEVRRLCSSLGCQRLRPQAWGPVLKFTVWCSSPSCLPVSAGVPLVTACGLDRNNQLWGKPRLPGRAQPLGTEFPESEMRMRMWMFEGPGPYAKVPGLHKIAPEP